MAAFEEELRRRSSDRLGSSATDAVSKEMEGEGQDQPINPKALGAFGKMESSLDSIILALLIKYVGQYDRTNLPSLQSAKSIVKDAKVGELARTILDILDDLKFKNKSGGGPATGRTIKDHLARAIGLLPE